MIDLSITEKEIVWKNEKYAIVIFDDMNYDILEKSIGKYAKEIPEENIKVGDTKITWKSVPHYTSDIRYVIQKLINLNIRESIKEQTLLDALIQAEKMYNRIKSEMNIQDTIEYRRLKTEYTQLLSKKKTSKEEP